LWYNEIVGELRIPSYSLLSPLLAPISSSSRRRRRRVSQKATYLKCGDGMGWDWKGRVNTLESASVLEVWNRGKECRLEIRGVHEEPLREVRIGLESNWEGISRLGRTNLAFG
jgi:hypothetical protein